MKFSSKTYTNKRKELLIEQRKLLIEKMNINKQLRNVQKEMNSLDTYLIAVAKQ